jgi:hypothetical protein
MAHRYELDSGAYWFNLLSNYFHTPGMWDPEALFASDPTIYEAAMAMLRVRAREAPAAGGVHISALGGSVHAGPKPISAYQALTPRLRELHA